MNVKMINWSLDYIISPLWLSTIIRFCNHICRHSHALQGSSACFSRLYISDSRLIYSTTSIPKRYLWEMFQSQSISVKNCKVNNAISPVHSLAPPVLSNHVPSPPIPSPSVSSPRHELLAVSAGLPAPASASPGCAASPVRSVSWAERTAETRRSRTTSVQSGPGAGPLWSCPAERPPPEHVQNKSHRAERSDMQYNERMVYWNTPMVIWIQGVRQPQISSLKVFCCFAVFAVAWEDVMFESYFTCRVLSSRWRWETLWRTSCWTKDQTRDQWASYMTYCCVSAFIGQRTQAV